MKYLLILICSLFCSLAQAQFISSEELFRSANNYDAQLSPNGQWMSHINLPKLTGEQRILLTKLDSMQQTNILEISAKLRIREYRWLNDEQLYLTVVNKNKPYRFVLTLSDLDSEPKSKKKELQQAGYIASFLPSEPNYVLYAKSTEHGYRLFKISIEDLLNSQFGKARLIEKNIDENTRVFFDTKVNKLISFAYQQEENRIQIKQRAMGERKWQEVLSIKNDDSYFLPIGFLTANKLAVLSNQKSDKIQVHSFDIKTKTLGEVLYAHDRYDVQDAWVSEQGPLLQSIAYYQSGRYKREYLASSYSRVKQQIAPLLAETSFFFTAVNLPTEQYIIFTHGSDSRGSYYLFNGKEKHLEQLFSEYEGEPLQLAKTEFIQFKAGDGHTIEAFLTQPLHFSNDTLLIYPHGGPIGVQDTQEFNATVQYLANRGFSVLKVNFRGSSGYGKSFQKMGVGQFGQLIEEDIMATLAHIKAQQRFKYKCAMGNSYGGYSATLLAMMHPDDFQCVIAGFGIYDLPLLFNMSNLRAQKEFREFVARTVGDYDDSLTQLSPVYRHQELQAPILLIAGEQDDISGFEQSYRFNYVLTQQGADIEHVFFEGVGHGFDLWRHEQAYAALVADFIQRKLSLPDWQSRLNSPTDKSAIAHDFWSIANTLAANDVSASRAGLAQHYFTQAANLAHAEATLHAAYGKHYGKDTDKDLEGAATLYETAAELGNQYAHRYLAELYWQGINNKPDFDKALTSAKQAYALESNKHNLLALARLRCNAPAPVGDDERCLEFLKLAEQRGAISPYVSDFNELIAAIVIENNLAQPQRQRALNIISKAFELTDEKYSLKLIDDGFYHKQFSEKHLGKTEYQHLGQQWPYNDQHQQADYFGLRYELDEDGMDSRKSRFIVFLKWQHLDADGQLLATRYDIQRGSPRGQWSNLLRLSNETAGTWHLNVYNVGAQQLYSTSYQVPVL
ncbi:prolyl oligopeptidase family serine peptidase [Pseudoalteromonas sp. T1lg48]|uniref:prolyl oligopeptidase family serine peptidase n=1 Tax=Pseudoalteromonas sp. T1lg48 TaxID=2077100 RepID=UPI000CF730CB|nr:prolyl oligopeptidase family serine peptidase [Pseudoalteromonas sp. T1lg48]